MQAIFLRTALASFVLGALSTAMFATFCELSHRFAMESEAIASETVYHTNDRAQVVSQLVATGLSPEEVILRITEKL